MAYYSRMRSRERQRDRERHSHRTRDIRIGLPAHDRECDGEAQHIIDAGAAVPQGTEPAQFDGSDPHGAEQHDSLTRVYRTTKKRAGRTGPFHLENAVIAGLL
jgi:hypothetical protein